jgi:hypothetical protein
MASVEETSLVQGQVPSWGIQCHRLTNEQWDPAGSAVALSGDYLQAWCSHCLFLSFMLSPRCLAYKSVCWFPSQPASQELNMKPTLRALSGTQQSHWGRWSEISVLKGEITFLLLFCCSHSAHRALSIATTVIIMAAYHPLSPLGGKEGIGAPVPGPRTWIWRTLSWGSGQ